MIGKATNVSPVSMHGFSTYITVNYCFNIQNFDAVLAFFQVARLPHRYSGFLAFAVPQLEPTTALISPFEYGM